MKKIKRFRKIMAFALACALCIALFTACESKKVPTGEPTGTPEVTPTAGPEIDPETGEPVKVLHKSKNGIDTSDNGYIHTDLTSVELVKLMGNGTNLGNTMEACDTGRGCFSLDPKAFETYWGQPVTTQEMLTAMKAAGFDSIRIPVAWFTNASTFLKDGNTTLNTAYLDRVEEIINYALNADMYVIINDHWDGGWWSMFGSATEATRTKAKEAYVSLWTQIATRYAEYSDRLIFEGANEEIGSSFNNDSVYVTDAKNDYWSLDKCYEVANEVNQLFVDTVRATGGNNASRFLLIPGYGTNIANTCDDRFKMPTDSAQNKLLISVHFYDPWNYCGDGQSSVKWGTKNDIQTIRTTLEKMTGFTKAGYGVVIGEYGVLHESELQDGTIEYHTNFLSLCDLFGYTSCLWDTSGFFKRSTLTMIDSEFAKLYKNNNYAMFDGMTDDQVAQVAERRIKKLVEAAPETFRTDVITVDDKTAVSWIMWNSNDFYSCTYSVGDTYNPDNISAGLKPIELKITGEGTYTVGLDFTGSDAGYSDGIGFAALAIGNGELLFPGYVIDIQEVLINGEPYKLMAKPFTISDDGTCTRVNLFNQWVPEVPDNVRTVDGNVEGCSASIINPALQIKTIMITFNYAPAK